MSTKKKDKKSNSGNDGEAKSEKGSATGKSWEIFRAEIIRETAKTFQVAKVLMEQFDGLEVTLESMDDMSASLDLSPRTLLWHRAMYETYVGASHVLEPRFDLEYLFRLPAALLAAFLPHMRRSDYLNECGLFTSTITSPESIHILYERKDDDVSTCDLLQCILTQDGEILAPIGKGHVLPIMSTSINSLKLVDDIVTPFAAFKFHVGGWAPKYDDPAQRYYDHITKCRSTADGSLKIPVYTSDDLAAAAKS
jgi:hypothetical protein